MKTAENPMRDLQIITLSLVAGATMFLGVVCLIMFQREISDLPPGPDAKRFLSIVLAAYGVAVVAVSMVDRFREPRLTSPDPFKIYQTFHILRLAILDGVTLLGLVSMIVHAPGVNLREHPWILANLVPYVTLLFFAAIHFPTRDKFDFLVKQANENVR